MRKINLLNIALFIFAGILVSCQKDPVVGNTSAVKVANEWWCHLLDESGNEIVGYSPFTTYNTSANKDSFWVDDNENIAGFKVKARFKSDQTFETTKAVNIYYPDDPDDPIYPEFVTISDGKVLTNAAKSKTGVVVDSIYMKIKFSNDPNTYIIEGKAKTGWDADDY